ncbi:MAG: ABC transporter ATP-binding protein [Firmicutes bacterium]|jgi:ABC-2 type transport system ATP-binding protein|nr:ABC transporter ATP-binding protein [Bacillota bacterium]
MRSMIKTESLTKYYGKSRGIVDVDLSIDEGDFFGFIGPNGAGKSTTIRILLGLISPTKGTAEIFGKDVTKEKKAILADIGYMPSETMFYHNRKAGEIIKLSADLRNRDCASEAAALCERLALDPEKKISQLSLGNRKKVSIVCALQHKPKLCVLDEPTSGLDPLIQGEFYKILEERNKAGVTIFLSSHVLSEVQKHCRCAAVIREGRLLVSDSIKNLGRTEAKRVTVKGMETLPAMEHVKNVKKIDDKIRFLYNGEPNALLRALSQLPLTDIEITEPDLEEIFLHYYTKEGEKHDIIEA